MADLDFDIDHPPTLLTRSRAARYLNEKHGIPLTPKTLKNRASTGLEPRPVYQGRKPYHRPEALDKWVEDSLKSAPAGAHKP